MIEYVNGDLLDTDCSIICQQVNCKGVMGSGLAKQIRAKYPKVFDEYSKYCKNEKESSKLLGQICLVPIGNKQFVANIFGQDGFGKATVYTEYSALERAFSDLHLLAKYNGMSIAIPHNIGCGLGGGEWSKVKKLIETYFNDVVCKVYKI